MSVEFLLNAELTYTKYSMLPKVVVLDDEIKGVRGVVREGLLKGMLWMLLQILH